jgi:hypothetical protein
VEGKFENELANMDVQKKMLSSYLFLKKERIKIRDENVDCAGTRRFTPPSRPTKVCLV